MGLFLGALVVLMMPSSLISIGELQLTLPPEVAAQNDTGELGAGEAGSASLTIWAVAALAGFKERTFNRKIKEIFEAALGTSKTAEQSADESLPHEPEAR